MTYEDFTTFTEVDGYGVITITETQISVDNQRNDDDGRVWKDYTADHFGDFEHLVSFYTGEDTANVKTKGYWTITTGLRTSTKAMNTANDGIIVSKYQGADYKRFHIIDYTNDNSDQWDGYAANTWYYATIERSSTTGTCKIYSNSARTVLVDTLSITVNETAHRYLYGFINSDSSVGGATTGDLYIKDLDLQEGNGATGFMTPNSKYWGT